jgi:PD-(D/E)XK nuclease superfamily
LSNDQPKLLRISWSRVRSHDECPALYDLRKANRSALADTRNFVHGNACDIAMRRWLEMREPPPGWMAAHIEEILDECSKPSKEGIVKWRSLNDRAEVLVFCTELVTRLEKHLNRYALPFTWRPAWRFEVPITIPGLDGGPRQILLIGEMDLTVEDALGRIVVWDLKATKEDGYYRKVLGQLTFYAIVIGALRGKMPAKVGLLQPMCKEQVLPLTVSVEDMRQMAARIERTAHDIWAGRTAPKADDSGCNWCDMQRACPKFDRPIGRTGLALAAR